jgi:hypothetical protein
VAALEVDLGPTDLAALEEVFPVGAGAGDRYPDMSGVEVSTPAI